MAGNAIIGALRVVLGLDSASFEDGLKNSSKNIHGFSASAVAAGNLISDSISSALKAVVTDVGAAVDKVQLIGKAAQKAGAPIEEFSALASSAGKVKIGVDELASGMEKLAKNMSAFAGGGKVTDAGRVFQLLGISVKDAEGNLKSSSGVISELAGKFENFQDSPAKTALAIAIFGKAGAEMIPLLNQGSAALKKQAAEMEELGLTIDQKTFKAAEQFNQSLTRLGKVKDSIIMKLTVGMLPALNDVSSAMVKVSKDTQTMEEISQVLSSTFKISTEVGLTLAVVIQQIGQQIKALVEAGKLIASGEFSKAFGVILESESKLDLAFKELQVRLESMWTKPSTDAADYANWLGVVEASLEAVANVKIAAPIIANSEAIDKFVNSTKKSLAAQDAETQTIGMAAGAKEKLRVVLQGLEVATANHIPITEALRARLNALGLDAEQSALKLAGMQLVFANKTPLEQYNIALANSQIEMQAAGATAEQLGRQQEKVAQQFGLSWQNIGTNIAGVGGALSQLTGTFAKENKAMGIASKAFGIGQAIINTQIAITKALATLPPPASYVAVALAIAQGAASVAAISAQSFAKGGSFMVPGGISGADNMMVPLNLASGERVDITPANDVGRGGRGRIDEIRIGVRLRDILTGENLRDMVEALNAGHRDGYKLSVEAA